MLTTLRQKRFSHLFLKTPGREPYERSGNPEGALILRNCRICDSLKRSKALTQDSVGLPYINKGSRVLLADYSQESLVLMVLHKDHQYFVPESGIIACSLPYGSATLKLMDHSVSNGIDIV